MESTIQESPRLLEHHIDLEDLNTQAFGYKANAYLDKLIKILENAAKGESSKIDQQICYIWAYEAKDVAIYLRDLALNLLKIEQYHKDGRKTEEEVEVFKKEALGTLNEASQSLIESHQRISNNEVASRPEWIHETNPVHLIKEQISDVSKQIKTIQRSQNKLDQINQTFSDYRSTYKDYMKERLNSGAHLFDQLESIKSFISSQSESLNKEGLNKTISKIQSAIDEVEGKKGFSPYQFIVLEDTDKLKLAVDSNKGKLIFKSIDILSEVSGWTSFNLTSPLKAVDTRLNVFKEKTQVGLFQLLNRIKAKIESSGDDVTIAKDNLISPIQKLLNEYNGELQKECIDKIAVLENDLQRFISPSQLFNEEYNFLPSSTLGQLSGFREASELERRYSLPRIRSSIAAYTERIFSRYSAKEQITASGYINNILSFDPESDANTLFLKNGFLGSSFSVDRPELMIKIENHFNLWMDDYGGALLVSGGHLSGRSTLLEMIPLVYPNVISHHIVPGQKMDVNGHKTTIGTDLIETLNFIIKYKGREKAIVTIDDMDYYSSNPADTFDLFEQLSILISKHSRHIYFVIAMHKYLHEKLSQYFDFENVFTETISTDYMPSDLIQQAVLTRAHAVVNNEDAITQSEQLSTMSRKVARKAEFNIGKAMQLWCMYQNGSYQGESSNNQFRTLIKRHEPILKMLVMHGAMKETEIRKMFNELDSYQLRLEIKSLIQKRLLVRPSEGYISINPYLVIFIESILNRN